MKSRELARKTVDFIHGDDITPEYAKEIGRRIASTVTDDPFDFARYVTKLLLRRARRAGRKRHRAPSPYKRNVAHAAIWAQWDAASGVDEDDAAAKRAKEYGVPRSAVFRAAFLRKDPKMNALMRELRGTPDLINRG